MNEAATGAAQRDNHRLVLGIYALQLAGLMLVFTPIAGLALNYACRARVEGTLYASHFEWQIRTVWWALLWSLSGGALMYIGSTPDLRIAGIIGAIAVLITAFWFMYRIIKGYLYLCARRRLPARDGA